MKFDMQECKSIFTLIASVLSIDKHEGHIFALNFSEKFIIL